MGMTGTGTPYNLPFPDDEEVARVPTHLGLLANAVEAALDTKPATTSIAGMVVSQGTEADSGGSGLIRILTGTTAPATAPSGTIIFMIAP